MSETWYSSWIEQLTISQRQCCSVRFEVLVAVRMMTSFYVVTPCGLIGR
jgi:hypothetical protein